MRTLHVVLIDPDDLSRHGLEALLHKSGAAIQVDGAFAAVADCLTYLQKHVADVLLIDDAVPGTSSLVHTVHRLHQQYPDIGLVVLSQHLDMDYIQNLFDHGVLGFVLKEVRLQAKLLFALETVAEGEPYLSPRASALPYHHRDQGQLGKLSARDREIAQLMQHGLTVQECATRLGISDGAVYRSRRKLRQALGVRTSEQIIDAAVRKGLLPAPTPS
jgi:DNA-binding NarL/FixJ family response regulator